MEMGSECTNKRTCLTMCHITPDILMNVTLLPSISGNEDSSGGIAVNADGTLFAAVDSWNRVCICAVDATGTRTSDDVVFDALGSPGSVCFVRRGGIDTLLICDVYHNCIVEITVDGCFVRRDVIAASLVGGTITLMRYEPISAIANIVLAEGKGLPTGLRFTPDGAHLLIIDRHNSRVSKFCAVSGAFMSHVATRAAHGIHYPTDALQCEDGSLMVVSMTGIVWVGVDGVTTQKIDVCLSGDDDDDFWSYMLAYFPALDGVIVKERAGSGRVVLLQDAWSHSLRCAWVSACVSIC
jgi:hypothetical protein